MDGASRTRRVAVETLGCRLNAYESDALKADFAERGYRVVEPGEAADVVVVNSCTVTDQADRKSRNALYRAGRSGGPEDGAQPLVVATGKGLMRGLRTWWFALAFVCIGLETRFRDLIAVDQGRPAIAFLLAQAVNILWTLLIAWLLFGGIVFAIPML